LEQKKPLYYVESKLNNSQPILGRFIELTFYDFESPASFKKCRFMWNYFYITWDGFVPPCCAKPFPKEKNFGSVFSNKLINVLNTKDFRDFRKDWQEENNPEFCDKCFNIYLESIHGESKNI